MPTAIRTSFATRQVLALKHYREYRRFDPSELRILWCSTLRLPIVDEAHRSSALDFPDLALAIPAMQHELFDSAVMSWRVD